MIRVLLALLTVQFTWAGRGSPTIEDEREALATFDKKFAKFSETVATADSKLMEIRTLTSQGGRAPRTDGVTMLIRSATQQWRSIGRFYDQCRAEGLDLHRQRSAQDNDLSSDLLTYLAIRKNNRFGTGIPDDLQLAMWRGLAEGTKFEEPPARLRTRASLEGVSVSTDDSLLIMTIRGGLIRGRFQGMNGDQIVLEEILSGTFTRAQRDRGHFRSLPLDNVARLEIIRRPQAMAVTESPTTIIDSAGFYTPYNVRPGLIVRVDYQPDDVEMVELIHDRRTRDIHYSPIVAPVDVENQDRPAYSHVFFADCGSLLSR